MLLTRSPLITGASTGSSFDLHVLSTPPAFILSQDQTLRKKQNGHNRSTAGKRGTGCTKQKIPAKNPHHATGWHNDRRFTNIKSVSTNLAHY